METAGEGVSLMVWLLSPRRISDETPEGYGTLTCASVLSVVFAVSDFWEKRWNPSSSLVSVLDRYHKYLPSTAITTALPNRFPSTIYTTPLSAQLVADSPETRQVD